jgi:hypothetical protein
VISGFGGRIHTEAMQRAHYDLVRWFVSGLYETTQIDWLFDWWQTLDAWVTELESAWPQRAMSSRRRPRALSSLRSGTWAMRLHGVADRQHHTGRPSRRVARFADRRQTADRSWAVTEPRRALPTSRERI